MILLGHYSLYLIDTRKGVKRMMIEDATVWVSLVSDFGYPFVVSMFLLFRFGKKLNELTVEVENLKKTGHKKRS